MRPSPGTFLCFLSFAALLSMPITASAQSPLVAQPEQTPAGWARVESLPPHAEIHLRTDRRNLTCHVDTVTADGLSCANSTFARSEIKSIQLAQRSRSTAGGLLLGAGIGAGVGVGIGLAVNKGDQGSFVHVSSAKSAGVGAGVGVILGAIIGAPLFRHKDIFATTIYQR